MPPGDHAVLHGFPYGALYGTNAVTRDTLVRWDDPATVPTSGDLAVSGIAVTGDGMVLSATNTGAGDQEFVLARVLCFDPDGAINDTVIAALDTGTVAAGATLDLMVPAVRFDGREPCTTFLASADGTISP